MTPSDHDPPDLSPAEAKERYLNHRRTDAKDSTVKGWHYRLKLFVEWARKNDIDSMSELDGWTLDDARPETAASDSTSSDERGSGPDTDATE